LEITEVTEDGGKHGEVYVMMFLMEVTIPPAGDVITVSRILDS